MTPDFHLDHIEMKISEDTMANANKCRNDVVITVKSTPLNELMKGWSKEEKDRMTQAVINSTNFRFHFFQSYRKEVRPVLP